MPKWKDYDEILIERQAMSKSIYPQGRLGQDDTFEAVFEDIFQEALDLLIERQRKYGPDNIASQGIYGIITRIADDKIARVRTAMNGRVVNGKVTIDPITDREAQDTFEDALLDIANYALIALALKRGLWGKPLRAPVAQRKEQLPSKQ